MSDLTREQVTNWISNVTAPGPVLAVNAGASRRIGESWLRLLTRAEKAEAERDEARAALQAISEAVVSGDADVHSEWEIYQELARICKQLARAALTPVPHEGDD